MAADADLRFELFPADLERFRDFYTRVLRFEVLADRRDEDGPYVYLRRGNVRIGAIPAWEAVDPRARSVPHGVEIVIEVDDLVAERDAITAAGYPLTEDIVERSWGLADFRLHDPDGYYLRFTTRA
jgi:catechol 2,3-dioxygenase-like lactoylglutathione lyase family enzyme